MFSGDDDDDGDDGDDDDDDGDDDDDINDGDDGDDDDDLSLILTLFQPNHALYLYLQLARSGALSRLLLRLELAEHLHRHDAHQRRFRDHKHLLDPAA